MTDDLAYFESEDFKKILQQYEDSVKSGHPVYMDADDLADIADYYHYEGRMDEADEAINLALQFNPDAVGPILYRAREALALNDFDTAWAYAERLQTTDATEYLYLKGEILICEGKVEEADNMFRQHFQEISPDDHLDYVYDVASLYSEYNQYDKSFEWMARSQGDDSDDFKELMARTLFGLGKYKDSERLFNELIDHNPYSNKYWNALASAQFMCEDYGASVTSSEYAIAIDPNDTESILTKANGLFRLENYEEALSYYERYSDMIDNDDFSYLHQGTCLISLGRFEEAIKPLKKAEELAQGDSQMLSEIYQALAFAYNALRQPENALNYVDKINDLKCDSLDMEVVRGHILMSNEHFDEAEDIFKQAIASSGNIPQTMFRIIISLYDNHFVKATYELFKKYLEHAVDDNWVDGYAYMAHCCWDLHKYDEFLKYLKIACEKNPHETKCVLSKLFPDDLKLEDYYDYMCKQLNKDQP